MTKQISIIIKEKREQLGLSIEEVSEKIFVSPKFLRRIEEEQWNKFPSKTHLKGFLKQYLSFLHIPVEIINQYPEIFSEHKDSQEPAPKKISVRKGKKINIVIIICIIIIFCLVLLIYKVKNSRGFISKAVIPSQSTLPMSSQHRGMNAKQIKTISFSLEAAGKVWVQASSSGKIIFENILNKGEKKNLRGEKIFIRMGNAGGLLIDYKGKILGPFGKSGEVKNIVVDKNFLSK